MKKYLVAEDGLAPSAYRQVNYDLWHVPRPDWTGRGVAEFKKIGESGSTRNHEKRDELV